MSLNRIITVSGWSAPAEIMAPLAAAIAQPEHIQHTSVSDLFAMHKTGDMSSYAEALSCVINAGDTPATVIAWSMGAIVTLETAINANLNVDRIVLISSTPRFCSASGYPAGVPAAKIRAMQAALVVNPRKTFQMFLQDSAYPHNSTEDILNNRLSAALGFGMKTLSHGLTYLRKTDLRNTTGSVAFPILALHGREDKIIPYTAAEQLANITPSVKLVTFKNAGHDLLTQNPEMLVPPIREFLA
ncbi:MAG: alpha/beta fold hydrolase [Kiritimatiellae bacterium]|nr:alpha/beta fold hydrolase [Kiritimatiellia bacterium]